MGDKWGNNGFEKFPHIVRESRTHTFRKNPETKLPPLAGQEALESLYKNQI